MVVSGFLLAVRDILFPFVIAFVIAYFLDPTVDYLETKGVKRGIASALIIVLFFSICFGMGSLILPILSSQLGDLLHRMPAYIELLKTKFFPMVGDSINKIDPQAMSKLQTAISDASTALFSTSGDMLKRVWSSGVAMLNIVSLFLIAPIVTFYVLRDWDKMVMKLKEWLPQKYAPIVLSQFHEIDETLSAYIRGQLNVCLILALFYSISLSIAGVDFGLGIGILTGILSFLPYVGFSIGCILGLLISYFQFDSLVHVAVVGLIFGVGQLLESYILTPNLVGNKVGLSAVWTIFAVLAGASLAGFMGALFAIPVAAICGVVLRFLLDRYLHSSLYLSDHSSHS